MSNYIFKGRLCGYICEDCSEPLYGIKVRLYKLRKDQDRTVLAVSDPKNTAAVLTEEQIRAKADYLFAEVEADANGQFSFELSDKEYKGEAFEIDIYCGTVPGHKPPKPVPPVQLSITTLQPQWRERDNVFVGGWDYCIPYRLWCFIRSLFGAWTICGTLITCEGGSPIPGAVVNAFDADWLQDDPLGSDTTDINGHFRIHYTSAQFKVTPFSPWINTECVSGPDVYFTATLGGTTIVQERQSDGRKRGRQNIGPCFCVSLCSDIIIGPPDQQPHWNKVWSFSIYPDAGQVGSQFSADGYAGGPSSSFVFGDSNYKGGVQLRGNCPLTNILAPSHALQYRFMIGEYTWTGTPDDPTTVPTVAPAQAALAPVIQIRPTTVGCVYYTDAFNHYGPGDVVITSADLDADGWVTPLMGKSVTVDMHDGTTSTVTINAGNFLRFDELMIMNSQVITAAHAPKLPGGLPKAQAGRALTTAEREPIRRYYLQFEVQDAVSSSTIYTDHLSSIILDNSPVIVALDIEELRTNVCSPLGGASSVHLLYTVDHPHLNNFGMSISNNSGLIHGAPPLPHGNFLPGPNLFFRGGNSGPHNSTNTGGFAQDISGDAPCAYSVSLGWSRREYLSSGDSTQMLYCK
jgi:hypothetical protein